ncbi:MAG: UDP-N-acetylmuramoyl-L-alanine--D-glutamate ligase [Acidobacteria bacterium]|nr:UDP-N-acetylmuramoyl-L-alanine--D-glutamate ligase [Acidobacteriota bacterium]
MNVAGKKILVVGIARSGVAAARLLAARGAQVTANDYKTETELVKSAVELAATIAELRQAGVHFVFGAHPLEIFLQADVIVLSPGVPANLAALESAREADIEIISEPELAGRFLRGRMIGVTGSNGKTTTTTLIGELMKAAGAEVIVGGNIGTALTSLVEQSHDHTWTIAELSSFQLETIESLRVQVALMTNITPDHLDRHGSFENYVQAKQRIFKNQTADDFAILNAESAAVVDMVAAFGAPSQAVWFTVKDDASKQIFLRDGQIYTTLLNPDGSEVAVLRLQEIAVPGMHNVENIMAALAATFCAMRTTLDELEPLREVLRHFKGVEHRLEFVAEINGVKFYNDSKATNVDSTMKALAAFERNVMVILGGKDKDSDYTVLAPLLKQRVKQIILLGAASDKIAAQLAGVRPMVRAASMSDAVAIAIESASQGDIVLLAPACASFDMFDNYEHRGRVFKDAVKSLVLGH